VPKRKEGERTSARRGRKPAAESAQAAAAAAEAVAAAADCRRAAVQVGVGGGVPDESGVAVHDGASSPPPGAQEVDRDNRRACRVTPVTASSRALDPENHSRASKVVRTSSWKANCASWFVARRTNRGRRPSHRSHFKRVTSAS